MLSFVEYILGNKHVENEYMQLTKTEEKMIEIFARKGMKTYYEFFKKEKMSSSTAYQNIEDLKKKNLVEIKQEEPFGRKKKLLGLTFKGLLYALKHNFIKPTEARNARIKNEINFPSIPQEIAKPPIPHQDFIKFFQIIERECPQKFYNFLKQIIDLDFYNEDLTRIFDELYNICNSNGLQTPT